MSGTLRWTTETLSGWGRYHPATARVCHPRDPEQVQAALAADIQPKLARGMGRSYGDAAQRTGGGILDMTDMNGFRDFDPENGILDCEAGVTLSEILAWFVPRGWTLPVVPGTRHITVGGAIANDVHGKNHHVDGSFCNHVVDFDLLTPARGVVRCGPGSEPRLFEATVGGVGLTGIILNARLRLERIESAWLEVEYEMCPDLASALAVMDATDAGYRFSVGWVDAIGKGGQGRTVLTRGNWLPASALPPGPCADPLRMPRRARLNVPVNMPEWLLNPTSVRLFNTLNWRRFGARGRVFLDMDRYFFPLDSVANWNRMYGRRGFVQYQATVPPASGQGLADLLRRCNTAGFASFLGVLKRFGSAGNGMLSHPMPGYTLTLDFPVREGLDRFLRECDRLLLDWGGRLYLAKDALALPDTIAAMYPRLGEFLAVRAEVDPGRTLASDLSDRLGWDDRK